MNGNLSIQVVDGALVIGQASPAEQSLRPEQFAEQSLVVPAPAPGFYVALDADGVLVRSVSVTVADRVVTAALVGNWVAQGLKVAHCDLKQLQKHLRKLDATQKAGAGEVESPESAAI